MNSDHQIVLILVDIRSALNVGALLRVASGMGVKSVITTGITPHFKQQTDERLPHVIDRATSQINKTSLGSETDLQLEHRHDISEAISDLQNDKFQILALEQTENSSNLSDFEPSSTRVALVVGNEVDGLKTEVIETCDDVIEIEMSGQKNSLNVATAGAIALFKLREDLSTT